MREETPYTVRVFHLFIFHLFYYTCEEALEISLFILYASLQLIQLMCALYFLYFWFL